MRIGRRIGRNSTPCPRLVVLFATVYTLSSFPSPAAAGAEPPKLVVVIYPHESDGAPGIIQVNSAIRATFADQPLGRIEVRNEYVDTTRLQDAAFMRAQVALLQQKYGGRKIDLVIAGLSSGLDFALAVRDEVFPRVPVVFVLVDRRELNARRLPPDVIGSPVRMDLAGTLDLALRLHPSTARVFVITGSSAFDRKWEAEARQLFGPYVDRLELVYLSGLPMDELLERVADLPDRTVIYYLHVFRDRTGKGFVPAEVLELLAARANAPVYSHVDTFIDRGAVGGHAYVHHAEGVTAARLGLRILSGEKPETIPAQEPGANTYLFNWRQLRRWGIDEQTLPPGSVVRFQEPTFWATYRWRVAGVITLCAVEALLIVGLVVQLLKRRRAEAALRASRQELLLLTRRLLEAQETERRRIARELHDDINQTLALLAVEIDLLAQRPPASTDQAASRLRDLSARIKELSSSVHDLSHQLHPSKLEQLGIVATVRGLCQELARHHGLEVKFHHSDVPADIPEDVALCLYRIAQEALRNVVKHSGTCRAVVELTGTPNGIRLRVGDDGVGFDPGAARGHEGLGLVSMRERLHLVGGEITIDSRPAGGTRIEVHVRTPAPSPVDRSLQAEPAECG